MVSLTSNETGFEIELSLLEKIGGLHSNIAIPRGAITSVRRTDDPMNAVRGLRAPGTAVPGVIALGQWRTRASKSFVAVYRNQPGYVVELEGQSFDRIVITAPRFPELERLDDPLFRPETC